MEENKDYEIEELNRKIDGLENKVKALENKLNEIRMPDTALLSNNFLTRAFAVLGHYIVAGLIISLPIYGIGIIVVLITAFGSR